LGKHPKIITDGSTQKLEKLVVTTVPYHCSKEQKSIWLDRGFTIRRQTGKPWIVLHHVPPKKGFGVSGEESEAAEILVAYRPDYFVAGHDHSFPYAYGQSWNQRLDRVRLLVPGVLLKAISESYQAGIPNRENCLGIPLATPGYRRTGSMIISAGVEEGLNNVTRRSCQNQTDSLPLRGLSALLTAHWESVQNYGTRGLR
jgi:hypothetical protein